MSGALQAVFTNLRSFIVPVPATGEAYGGGYFAGLIATGGGGVATHLLIIAPKATGENLSKTWKTTNTDTTGTSSAIDGPTNSANMNDANHPAAQFCEGLTIGGYSDWYMPARNELEVCYYFLKPTTTLNDTATGANANAVSPEPISTNYTTGSPIQTTATAFRTGGAEVFNSANYWASTQFDTTRAAAQYFLNGNQANGPKNDPNPVRAVRRIAI